MSGKTKPTEADIEEYITRHLDEVIPDESMLLVGRQLLDSNRGRSDLVAIDSAANLAVIEVKRGARAMAKRREPAEIQAIRYAASLARIRTPEELIDKVFKQYIGSRNSAEIQLNMFLKRNPSRTFNVTQRLILIALDFDKNTIGAAQWLANNNIGIDCIQMVQLQNDGMLSFKPVKVAGAFPDIPERRTKKRSGPPSQQRISALIEWGALKPDDLLWIRGKALDSSALLVDAEHVLAGGVRKTIQDWAKEATGWSAVNLLNHVLKGSNTLGELYDSTAFILSMGPGGR